MKKKIKFLPAVLAALFLCAVPFFVRAQYGGWNPGNYGIFGLPEGTIAGILENLLLWVLGIFGIIGVIGFVIAGIMYLTAAGDDDQIKKAKAAMKWSLVGVIVGIVGLVVLYAVDRLLWGSTTYF